MTSKQNYPHRRCLDLAAWRLLTLCSALLCAGCGGKSVVSELREGTPAEAAARVMTLYDGDNDGKLAAAELAASPGILDGLSRIDSNRDGSVDLAEMTARFTVHDDLSDIIPTQVEVTAAGTPLEGATVIFTLDPCMGEGKQTYRGSTVAGIAQPMGETTSIPTPIGYYTVQIVHSATGVDVTRGCEIANDTPSPNRRAIDVSGKTPATSRSR
jgi:hypothetical protein